MTFTQSYCVPVIYVVVQVDKFCQTNSSFFQFFCLYFFSLYLTCISTFPPHQPPNCTPHPTTSHPHNTHVCFNVYEEFSATLNLKICTNMLLATTAKSAYWTIPSSSALASETIALICTRDNPKSAEVKQGPNCSVGK